jgi:hypothetical protein
VQQSLNFGGTSDVCSQLVKLLFKDKFYVMCFSVCIYVIYVIISMFEGIIEPPK